MNLEPSQSRIIERVEVQHGIVRFTAENVNTARFGWSVALTIVLIAAAVAG